jgi:hypothetical protein
MRRLWSTVHVKAVSCVAILLAAGVGLAPASAAAQTDEIQVYDAAITEPDQLSLTLHNNFTPTGLKTPAFPGGLVSDKALVGVAEWAYGATGWFEAGLYLPLYSISTNLGATLNGFKLRALFVVPHAQQRRFFYGANFEFSVNAKRWDPTRITSEIRPIVGLHLPRVDVIVNPILDTSYDGFRNLDFAPATRVAWLFSSRWAGAVEEYADFGPLHRFYAAEGQPHQLYGVVDYNGEPWNLEAGLGIGLTGATDRVTLKLILSRDLK